MSGITAIGVDKVQYRRGHKYLTVVYQINDGCRRLLWVGQHRTAKTLLRLFKDFGKDRTADIRYVCSDMWQAYLLKESFQLLWGYVSPTWAGRYPDAWITRALRSHLEPIKTVARSLRIHRELILNWFRAKKQFSSPPAADRGFERQCQTDVQKSIRLPHLLRLRRTEIVLYHILGQLPEPKLTHTFC